MKINDVGPDNLFQPVYAGDMIRYPDKDTVQAMVVEIGGLK
jgi:hypothetical protein